MNASRPWLEPTIRREDRLANASSANTKVPEGCKQVAAAAQASVERRPLFAVENVERNTKAAASALKGCLRIDSIEVKALRGLLLF